MMINKKILINPIIIVLLFSAGTMFLYLFGPYKYPEINRIGIVLFWAISNIMMLLGYYTGLKYYFVRSSYCCSVNNTSQYNQRNNFNFEKIFNFLFWIAMINSIPKFILYTGAYDLSIFSIFNKATLFFTSAQEIYVQRQSLGSATGVWRYINYFVVLCGPFYWAYTPLAIFHWKTLSIKKKIGTLFIWFFYLMQYLITGTNVGFFDFFLTVVIVTLVKSCLRKRSGQSVKRGKVFLVLVVVMVILLFIFGTVMGSRIGNQYLNGGSLGKYRYTINEQSILFRFIPDPYKPMISYLTRYLANSYNALAFALNMPFETTYGLGHSWFLLDNLNKGLSNFLWDRTYNMKIEEAYGFDHYSNWHTVYLWIANDVSFLGVPIILFILFFYFGRAWKCFLVENDMFSFLIFMIFAKFSYFISANNQVFQNSDTLIAFWLLFVFFLFGKKCKMKKTYEISS